MAGLLQQLSGNPLSTPIGQKIDQASETRDEDWALIMEICDEINDTDDGPREAVRAIRKKLSQTAGKNNLVVMRTLVILETCVKNCGRRFHTLVMSKDFASDLVKLIGPKNDPPPALQEKVLSLIQTWADTFRSHSDLNGIHSMYMELKNKGIEFPAQDLDTMVPIHTPSRSVVTPPNNCTEAMNIRPSNQEAPPSGAVTLNPEQLSKLTQELSIVDGNVKVFNEMLDQMTPGKSDDPDELELMNQLNSTCRGMQSRIVSLLQRVANEDVTVELLRINDDLNNVFARFDSFCKKSRSPVKSSGNHSQSAPVSASLIDLEVDDPSPDLNLQLAGMSVAGTSVAGTSVAGTSVAGMSVAGMSAAGTSVSHSRSPPRSMNRDDFDDFAQSRSSTTAGTTSRPVMTTAGYASSDLVDSNLGALTQMRATRDLAAAADVREEDFDEMEQWLKDQEAGAASGMASNQNSSRSGVKTETVDSADFERFLLERAVAAESLPSVNRDKTSPSPPKDLFK